MVNKIKPGEPSGGNTYGGGVQLPRGLLEGLLLFEAEPDFRKIFGEEFVGIYAGVKRGEFETFMQVISPWEREYLLMNV
jgi:glutamine synthetase